MEFKLPDIGEGVHEGEIVKWLVKEGDAIAADQPMVEVMTDKATVEIPSPVAGTIAKIHAADGVTIEVGKVIVSIAEKGKAAAAPAAEAKAPAAKPESKPVPQRQAAKAPAHEEAEAANEETARQSESEPLPFEILATPATRKLARDLDVDLRQLKGTGTQGRITKTDVQLAAEGVDAATERPSHSAAASMSLSRTTTSSPSSQVAVRQAAFHGGENETRIPLRGIRKKIAEAMTRSKHTAAHFTYVEEVDMTEVVRLRKEAKGEGEKMGVKLTFLPFIIKAVVPALKEFPMLNSSLDDDKQEIVMKNYFNFGIATDTQNGLMVPVIKNADRKTVWELADDITTLSDRARNGKSQMEDLKGGTFTFTNAGSIGGVFATPVINHPEVAIMGVNSIRKRPMVIDDKIEIRDMMYLSLSVDHRVVDGADAARFMNRVVFYLSNPMRLVFA